MKFDGKYEVEVVMEVSSLMLLCLPVSLDGNLGVEVRLEVEVIVCFRLDVLAAPVDSELMQYQVFTINILLSLSLFGHNPNQQNK